MTVPPIASFDARTDAFRAWLRAVLEEAGASSTPNPHASNGRYDPPAGIGAPAAPARPSDIRTSG